ncbi:MAG TPA: STN domain-containing protein, partial [Rhizomicrobium sp.]|nr:STN domain-containing protein [Rhizomicrobium sp.]
MKRLTSWKVILAGGACVAALSTSAYSAEFNISGGDLNTALGAYSAETGVQIVMSYDAVKGVQSRGVKGNLTPDEALSRLLSNTGFTVQRRPSGAIAIIRDHSSRNEYEIAPNMALAQATPQPRSVETVTVTSSKLGGGDVQSIPIAITALSQEQLTASQTTGGPDLIKQVPNMTFTKTNFSG